MSDRSRTPALLSRLLVLIFFFSPALVRAQVYSGKPKLIVIVVIDQFRGDYLNRFHDQFKGRGFRLFTDEGAWFTNCYYDYANTKTAPGHATIGTGAYTDGHGIESNEWWDFSRTDTHAVSSVEDERYQLVDVPSAVLPSNQPNAPKDAPTFLIGSSPRNLRATTLGDELRLATQGKARVFGVSLKDRAAILPAGQSANAAYWLEPSSGQFTTSTYYMDHLPEWVRAFNSGPRREQAAHEALADGTNQFFEQVGHMPAANSYELDFARALIQNEKLGQDGVTDEVTISLSANDIAGHSFGPDSPQEQRMVLSLDKDLDSFFGWLDQTVGLKNVWLALTADHGVAPVPSEAAALGIAATTIDMNAVYTTLNDKLNARFSPRSSGQYIVAPPDLPYITLNKSAFEKAKVDENTAEDAVAALLPDAVAASAPTTKDTLPAQHRLAPVPRLQAAYTRLKLANGSLPPTEFGRRIGHSYADHGNWFVMAIFDAYQIQFSSAGGTTHFSPWSYDRHVPLAFYGAPFVPADINSVVAEPMIPEVNVFANVSRLNQSASRPATCRGSKLSTLKRAISVTGSLPIDVAVRLTRVLA